MRNFYLFKRENCPNCPAAEAVVREFVQEKSCDVGLSVIDADFIDGDLYYRLLNNSIFVFSVPMLVFETDDEMVIVSSGIVPTYRMLKKAIGD